MVYVLPLTKLRPLDGWTLSVVTPSGGRETGQGCAAGTLLEAPDSSLVDSGLAEEGPPRAAPTTDAGRAALVDGKSRAFVSACGLLGYVYPATP